PLILCAEDNPVNQKVIRLQLEKLGYRVHMTADGKEALAAWRSQSFALLLTDCHMPNMDGYDLTRAIRTEEQGRAKSTHIVALTANALEGEARICLEAGMDGYLSKPVDMAKLKETLARWIETPAVA
ncbi:MAG: response regulator, partial [Geminicoccaceae bacterium]